MTVRQVASGPATMAIPWFCAVTAGSVPDGLGTVEVAGSGSRARRRRTRG